MISEFERLRKFLSDNAIRLPGESAIPNSNAYSKYVTPDGILWRKHSELILYEARTFLSRGAQLWCTIEGSWPPFKLADESGTAFLELVEDLGIESGDPNAELEEATIELWRPRKSKKLDRHFGKGQIPKPIVFFRLYW